MPDASGSLELWEGGREKGNAFLNPILKDEEGFSGKDGSGTGIDPGRGSSRVKGLGGKTVWSFWEQWVTPSDHRTELEGKVTKGEAAEESKATCTERILST